MKRIHLATITALLAGLFTSSAQANPCGVGERLWATPMYVITWSLAANTSYSFETTNLAALTPPYVADSVMHVQDYATGNYIAGNDDYIGLASRVDYRPTTAQTVRIIVRAYSDYQDGSATFNIWQNGSLQFTHAITFGGRAMDLSASGLVAGTDIMSVENFDGPRDSVLLVVSGGASHAIAFDDDSGLDLQSWLHLNSNCPVGDCKIIYGSYYPNSAGWISVLADGDVHTGHDADHDGLGDCLEGHYGTNPNLADSDADGLSDSAEIIGVDSTTSPVKLATWGANPLKKDMFVELDWDACDVVNNTGCGGNADAYQMTGPDAETVIGYFAPDINVHMDIGVDHPATTDKAKWTQWGNWWGASRSGPFTAYCDTLTPSRVGIFHHFHITSLASSGGGKSQNPGTCGFGSSGQRTVAHELGHQVGLAHEGNTGTGRINSKPNYLSIMNYAYAYNNLVGFSRNTQPTLTVSSLSETNSPLSTDMLTYLNISDYHFKTDPANHKIDWNRDGQYDSSVRGATNWIFNGDPETTGAYHDFGMADLQAPTFARSSSPARFYMFSISGTAFQMQYRYTTSFSACSGNSDATLPCVSWTGPTVISNSRSVGGLSGVSAAYRVTVGSVQKMMLVYTDSSGTVWYQLGDSAGTWSTPKAATATTTGLFKMALVPSGPGGKLRLYYKNQITGRVLNSSDYDPSKDTWGSANVELDDSGNTIPVELGVSVIQGKDATGATAWFMALANPTISGLVELWRYNSTTSRWSKLTAAWPNGQPITLAGPALAYVPFSTSDSTKGQFFLAYNDIGSCSRTHLMKTEGNDTSTSATSRRLQFRDASISFFNDWSCPVVSSPALFYEIGSDTNLRGAITTAPTPAPNHISFFPVADGMPSITLKDQDDFYYMTNTLKCSLGQGGCIPL